jgi:hypothetical protein
MSKPYVGKMVQFYNSLDQLNKLSPLAACVVVASGTHVSLAGWDRIGQPWTKSCVPFGGPAPGGAAYCIPAPSDETA